MVRMNSHVRKYYKKLQGERPLQGHFHEVIALHEDGRPSWKKIQEKVPYVPKGWYELSLLSQRDRIEFVKDFWLSTLPFIPHIHDALIKFFSSLDDVGVFLLQWAEGLSFECEIVYSLKDDSCFYHGAPPANETEIALLNDQFGGFLPTDFLRFLLIHDGFSKHSDTGVFRAQDIPRIHRRFVQDINDLNILIKTHDHVVDPYNLIPFYESFGQRSYQCFCKEWYPAAEMGNVFFSFKDRMVSDFERKGHSEDTLAFVSFLDWLTFYLEGLEG